MVYVKHATEIKERAVELFGKGREVEQITEDLRVSESSVRRWAEYFREFRTVQQPGMPQGRPTKLTADAVDGLVRLIDAEPGIFLDELQTWLQATYGLE